MITKHTSYIVRRGDGKLLALLVRGLFVDNPHCNAGHNKEVGEFIFWHGTDFNMTRYEGIVIAKQSCDWDNSLPMGKRATNVIESENYTANLKKYRSLPVIS